MASSTTKILFIFVAVFLLHVCSARSRVPLAEGNGVIACRPGLNFPRDCGNRCQCRDDGLSATCTSTPCPTTHAEFDAAHLEVYKELDKLKTNGTTPVFQCKPYTERKVNDINGSCYCARSGTSEICGTRIGDPWGMNI